MTKNLTSYDIADEIEEIRSKIATAQAAAPVFGDPAIAKVDELSKLLHDAKERFASALADEVIDARNKRLSKFSSIRVETKPDDQNLINTGFAIHYTQDTWDIDLNATVPKPHTCNGFAALSNDAYDYLVTVKPEAIPAAIMALVPGNPQAAMSTYLAGKARGYFKGRTVAA
jgi:hypothetical protein